MAQTADSTTPLNPHTCLRVCVAYMAAETGDGCQEGEGDLVDLWHGSSCRERTRIVDAAREHLAERERGVLKAVKHLERIRTDTLERREYKEHDPQHPDELLRDEVVRALVALGYGYDLGERKAFPLEGGEA